VRAEQVDVADEVVEEEPGRGVERSLKRLEWGCSCCSSVVVV